MKRLLLLVTAFVIASSLSARAACDAQELDRLQKVFASTPQFGEQFWRESKRIADQCGPSIIHSLMKHAEKWEGEQGLIFVPLVALLPRSAALKVLREYDRKQEHGGWAKEFLTELDMPDTKEMVGKFSGRK
jgi:hypothetical protein